MEKFIEIIDTFLLNYSNYKHGKYEFECEYGELVFYKNNMNKNTIIIHGIYIKPDYRNKGICKNILNYLIDICSKQYKYLYIQSVISKILFEYLLRYNYKKKFFLLKKEGFVCRL
jgi:GNAT superfamily N-acetyltransferase